MADGKPVIPRNLNHIQDTRIQPQPLDTETSLRSGVLRPDNLRPLADN